MEREVVVGENNNNNKKKVKGSGNVEKMTAGDGLWILTGKKKSDTNPLVTYGSSEWGVFDWKSFRKLQKNVLFDCRNVEILEFRFNQLRSLWVCSDKQYSYTPIRHNITNTISCCFCE